ncbi:MAG: efflux RND transporter periplasmic adaptor subunit [Luminiphilus sp.]|nr:efflux RND transporter periplasmic adaptor subunit [Luminiphilus sp.]
MSESASSRSSFSVKKLLTPITIIALSLVIYTVLINNKPEIVTAAKEPVPVAVRALTVIPQTLALSVTSEGNVQPRVEMELVTQVAGEVISVASSLLTGGEFSAGDTLITVDPRDYEIALLRARSSLARATAELNFAIEEQVRVRALYAKELASLAQLQAIERAFLVAQSAEADAAARVSRAQIDLERTVLKAPFSGRVRDEAVDVGQFLQKGRAVATLYDTERLEVRLPLADAQLAYLDREFANTGIASADFVPVTLTANFGGRLQSWTAQLMRSEGDISTTSRFLYVIAEVSNSTNENGMRLPVGLFVNATIQGRTVDELVSIPRTALRSGNNVMVIDESNRLRFREVQIFRLSETHALISEGLNSGERISISALQFVVEGMPVQVIQ